MSREDIKSFCYGRKKGLRENTWCKDDEDSKDNLPPFAFGVELGSLAAADCGQTAHGKGAKSETKNECRTQGGD